MSEMMNVVNAKLSDIKTNPNNPRLIKDDKFKKLVKSIKDFPEMLQIRPIVVNSDMVVLGGNMRLKACKEAGLKEVPIIRADELTEDQQREFIIKDNVGFGEWEWDMIRADWDVNELAEWGLDIPEFETAELEAVEDDYEMPDQVETDIVLGDLYEIGEHRLLCGDSTDSDQVAKLMSEAKADVVVTDPPYNTGMKPNGDAKARLSHIFNDSFTDKEWEDFVAGFFSNYNLYTKGQCALYVFIDWRRVNDIRVGLERIADVKNVIVWDKQVHGLGSDYKSTYEMCVVGKKGKPEINNRYGLDYQDIWRVQRQMGRVKEHATQKPIELLSKPILHASKEDDTVLDLFLGSGSTMVASHQLKRKCYGMELDPKYCQVIVDRMIKLDPTLTIKRNGEPYQVTGEKQVE
jgi:site-specific DNA-methyltransferase (adenine-specific)